MRPYRRAGKEDLVASMVTWMGVGALCGMVELLSRTAW